MIPPKPPLLRITTTSFERTSGLSRWTISSAPGLVERGLTGCCDVLNDLHRVQALIGLQLLHARDLRKNYAIGFGQSARELLLEYRTARRIRTRFKKRPETPARKAVP
jgi:hypothetical protein